MRLMMACCAGLLGLMTALPCSAVDDAPQGGAASRPVQVSSAQLDLSAQANLNAAQTIRYHQLIEQYRCPKCQNANLAGSDAPIAQDLKHKILQMVAANQSDGEIRDYLVSRYGEFISYQPVVKPATWLLWFLPPLLLVVGGLVWLLRSRRAVAVTAPLSAEEQWRLQQLLGSKEAVRRDGVQGSDHDRQ